MKLSTLFNIQNISDIMPSLSKSRTVQTALLELIIAIAICLVPEFEPYRNDLLQFLAAIGFVPMFRFAGEDIAVAFKTGQRNVKYDTPPATANIYKDNPALTK